ncbi:hypothetical protein BDZ91DRAFT_711849 [Kalaharituber pfeilii]|nr:hypothetical protein BDZ91DRAFT_711849 [Kalaharituber pfeilii]
MITCSALKMGAHLRHWKVMCSSVRIIYTLAPLNCLAHSSCTSATTRANMASIPTYATLNSPLLRHPDFWLTVSPVYDLVHRHPCQKPSTASTTLHRTHSKL